ncbi:transmembrane protein 170B [Alligator sinensis]|uniref:Transmembrane protein 170B n=2 Tax=Crocodylia TaxID=1294634 RepID=A0A1U7S760_ALLSI|nr:transmembrane protein 170B [Alligator sinensis]
MTSGILLLASRPESPTTITPCCRKGFGFFDHTPYFSEREMWYWVFLWALFSSLFVHGAVAVLMFVMLQRHRQGRLISVIVVSIGFLGSVTGAMITSAAVAGIYRVAGKNMAPLEALVFGVGQTVLTLIISFSRILATL